MRGAPTATVLLLAAGLLLAGCGAHVRHVVQKGETLYSISFRYGQDFRDVASWNGIDPPYAIRPGDQIRIVPPPRAAVTHAPETRSAPASGAPQASTPAPATPRPAPARDPAPRPAPAVATPVWSWPVAGLPGRGEVSVRSARRGLEIAAPRGEPVRAAAAGRVVYGGSGIPHYGNLLIIKHNEQFLSAYAHNERLLVSEGQEVAAGQQVAEVGDSGTGAAGVGLHFEIRLDGTPVDPRRYLPRR